MKIGITERGDAGIDFSWYYKSNSVDGMILITKVINDEFINKVLELHSKGVKIIVHCTCTGYGYTLMEPFVPSYKEQLNNLLKLITLGFPVDRCVLRIDPIFPTAKGVEKIDEVLKYFCTLNISITRVRVSILDEYKHVKDRFKARGWTPIYGDRFYPTFEQCKLVANTLNKYSFIYELCAEKHLASLLHNGQSVGCVSKKDLAILGLPIIDMDINPQNRNGCLCLACKTDLLTYGKRCPNKCVYCYWKQNN